METPAGYRETTARDWLRVTGALLGWGAASIVALAALPLAGAAVAACGLAALTRAHAARSGWRCAACGRVLRARARDLVLNRQGVARLPDGRRQGWLLLRCLSCGEHTRATWLVRMCGGIEPGRVR